MATQDRDTIILIPILDDWHAGLALVEMLDDALGKKGLRADVLLLDDGSVKHCPTHHPRRAWSSIGRAWVLRLKRNLGHQRAIAVGLTYARAHTTAHTFLIMDGDGEDAPADAVRLIEEYLRHEPRNCVFAQRRRRSEGYAFSILYWLYRTVHLLLTGTAVRVGNFSVIPSAVVDGLIVSPALWNHYAAAVFHGRFPITTIAADRRERISGCSKMGLLRLVVHGLRAMSVYSDLIGVRLLVAAVAGVAAVVVGMALGAYLGLADPGARPWVISVTMALLVLLLQALGLCFVFAMLAILHGQATGFIPLRDCQLMIASVDTLIER